MGGRVGPSRERDKSKGMISGGRFLMRRAGTPQQGKGKKSNLKKPLWKNWGCRNFLPPHNRGPADFQFFLLQQASQRCQSCVSWPTNFSSWVGNPFCRGKLVLATGGRLCATKQSAGYWDPLSVTNIDLLYSPFLKTDVHSFGLHFENV